MSVHLRQRLQQAAEAAARRDRQRQNRITENAKKPVLPGLSTLFFCLTLGSAVSSIFAETYSWRKYHTYGPNKYLANLSFSMFYSWLIFGIITAVLSLSRLRQLVADPSCALKPVPGEPPAWYRPLRGRTETPERYTRRCWICLIGLALLFLFYAGIWF